MGGEWPRHHACMGGITALVCMLCPRDPLAPQFPADPGEYRSQCLGHMRLMGSGPRPQGSIRSQEKELKPRLPSCGTAGNVGLSWGQLRGLGGGGRDGQPLLF